MQERLKESRVLDVLIGICSCNSCIHYIQVDKQSEAHLSWSVGRD